MSAELYGAGYLNPVHSLYEMLLTELDQSGSPYREALGDTSLDQHTTTVRTIRITALDTLGEVVPGVILSKGYIARQSSTNYSNTVTWNTGQPAAWRSSAGFVAFCPARGCLSTLC
jgi:hypothetical protein